MKEAVERLKGVRKVGYSLKVQTGELANSLALESQQRRTCGHELTMRGVVLCIVVQPHTQLGLQ